MTNTPIVIPMPGLLADREGTASDRDPATSHEHAPIEGRPLRDPSGVDRDEPVTRYARQLWAELDAVAAYLRDSIARAEGGPLLRTEQQWEQWRAIYGAALSVLAGPAGDGGYGEQEATLEYQNGRA